MTPAGIEPATSRFLSQQISHCATAVLYIYIYIYVCVCVCVCPIYVYTGKKNIMQKVGAVLNPIKRNIACYALLFITTILHSCSVAQVIFRSNEY